MEWTFQCRLLFSSAKHLLICRDVTATTDIRLHYFPGTFAVATNERDESAFLRRMYTDYCAGRLSSETVAYTRFVQL